MPNSDEDIIKILNSDQSLEAIKDGARQIGIFYRTLLGEVIDPNVAVQLTLVWLQSVVMRANVTSSDEN